MTTVAMGTAKVFTNMSCNQACRHCVSRSPRDEPSFVGRAAVEKRVDDVRGAKEIVFSGGEPTLMRDLPRFVARAAAAGARVGIETNATLVDDARARALADAGLVFARVNLAVWGPALDDVTRDPGGFDATKRGISALLLAGVDVEVAAVLVASTQEALPRLPHELATAFGPDAISAIVVTVPVESPEPDSLIAYEVAVPTLVRLDTAARAAGIRLRIAPDSGPPPCFFPHQTRITHLYTMTPGARRRPDTTAVDACSRCAAADRCTGVSTAYLARRGQPDVTPITDDRIRRRLSIVSSVDAQIERELVSPNQSRVDGVRTDERIIRVNFQCNQACGFCFVSTHLPGAKDDAIRAAISTAVADGAHIVLSGGEPTLNPRLAEYIALAKSLGSPMVEVQTNATLLDEPGRVDALVRAGIDRAFVSLHGATAEVSDAVTGAPGTFARTQRGIDALTAAGVLTVLNFVICRTNAHELPQVVRLMAARWPSARLSVSFVAPSADVVPQDAEMIPRYADAIPHLAAAIDEATRLSVTLTGYDSMCGVPLCLVPHDKAAFFDLATIPPGFDQGEFVKPDACGQCALSERCFGLRRRYADLHGTAELTPVIA